jgi:hypothetical protein
MDNEIDQVVNGLISNDSNGNQPVAKSTDDPLDAAILDMVPTLPDF